MKLCDRCESPIDKDRPGYDTPHGTPVHARCPEFSGQMVDLDDLAEAFEVDGAPRIVYVEAGDRDPRNETERLDLQDAVEDHYERAISWGSWRLYAASWVVPSPTQYNGMVWVCRTDGWAPNNGLEE